MLINVLCSNLLILSVMVAQALPPTNAVVDENDRSLQIQLKSSEWMKVSSDAQKSVERGDYEDAIQKYNSILEDRKTLGLDLLNELMALANVYEKSGRAQKADEYYVEAIKLREQAGGDDDPILIFPIQAYAEFLKRTNKVAESENQLKRIAYIEKQRKEPPKELVALIARTDITKNEQSDQAVLIGDLYLKRDQESRAIMAFNKAVEWNPSNAAAYAGRGEAYGRLEQDSKAKHDYDQAIKLQPSNTRALFRRALYFENLKKNDAALVDFQKAIEANPRDIDVIGYRAKLYQNTNRPKLAVVDYSTILEIAPKTRWARVQRGLAYSDAGEYDKAMEDFSELLKLNPNNEDYIQLRDELLKKMKVAH